MNKDWSNYAQGVIFTSDCKTRVDELLACIAWMNENKPQDSLYTLHITPRLMHELLFAGMIKSEDMQMGCYRAYINSNLSDVIPWEFVER